MADQIKDDSVDMINHPPHYTACPSGIECIQIAELLPFCLGNCYKYLHRAGLKGDKLTDLQKAVFYARRASGNNETLPPKAKVQIMAVARHQSGDKKQLLTYFAQKPIDWFYLYLEKYVKKYA